MDFPGLLRAKAACLLALFVTVLAPAASGDDLHALVERWLGGDASAVADELATWSTARARSAARGVRQGDRWSDPRVLGAALLYTQAGEAEMRRGLGSGLEWVDLASEVLQGVADEALRRRLRRDWMLALAAFHASRYDGWRARDLLDRAVRDFPDDPDVLFAAGRLHEAIGCRPFSGLAEIAPLGVADASGPELVLAAQLFERVMKAQPAHGAARLRHGRVLALLGQTRPARAELERLLASSPEPDVRCLAHLFLGAMAENRGRLAEALSEYRTALATGRSAQVAPLALAHLLERRGEAAAARRALEGVLATAGDPASLEDAWWRYVVDGLGEASGADDRFEALRQEARR